MAGAALAHGYGMSARLSLMEKELADEKADLARLLQDQRHLIEGRARLESALEAERKTSNEKIELSPVPAKNCATPLKQWPPTL